MNRFKNTWFWCLNFFRKLKFFFQEKLSEVLDSGLLFLNVNDNSLHDLGNLGQTIVFAGLHINHRVIKHLKYLKKTNQYIIVVLTHKSDRSNDLLDSYYDIKISFRNKSHLKRILYCSGKLKMIYAFASKPSYARSAMEVAKCPVIFDPYDCWVVYYGKYPKQKWMQREIVDEEFCFRNASAILARNLEIKKSLEIYAIKDAKSILFSDYCDNDYFVNSVKKDLNSISIVYPGGIYRKNDVKSSHGIGYLFELSELLNQQSIELHIYPSPHTSPEIYNEYVEEAKKLQYLFVHPTLAQNNLLKEIAKYDFGVSPHFREQASLISKDKLERGTSLKFFNFLEAGLPILMSSEMKYMAWIIERYKIGIVFSIEDIPRLSEIIRQVDYSSIQKNVLMMREKLSMKSNLNRLVTFIENI